MTESEMTISEWVKGQEEELAAYRAIGTAEEFKALKDDFWKLNEMCREYSAIGTVEELQKMKDDALASGAEFRHGHVLSVAPYKDMFMLAVGNDVIEARRVILATGAVIPKTLEGEAERIGRVRQRAGLVRHLADAEADARPDVLKRGARSAADNG